ncbi:hypothetical protein F5883DRAFT_600302 [Diaporthe sp. PMI_573]|nr:hypothetical protein F5883DRAFT_600302 [Diaporthaceae sp. PMI_573]
MYIIAQWIRNRRERRRLLEERKKREAERQIQREKQDFEHGRALQLILHGLQATMDPLIASQAYNNRFCLLTRLPEELLLNVLDFLRGDDVTLCCLRVTSRIFLRLLNGQSDVWSTRIMVGFPCSLERGMLLQFRRLLQRDGRCENCRRWNDAHVRFAHDSCKFQGSYLRQNPTFFGFGYWPNEYARPYCSACETDHDVCQFPMAYHTPPQLQNLRPQPCLGQQGSVRLCEHVYITWASIKAHIDDWRRRRLQQRGEGGAGNNWQECLESFKIECYDATHDIRCTTSEAPTRPQARLGTSRGFSDRDPDIVVLYLQWTPHGRVDALMPTTDGRIPASDLRALFRKFRRLGPADMLYPPGYPETLPEMACLRPSFPIYYEMGEKEERVGDVGSTFPARQPSTSPPSPLNQEQLSRRCQSLSSLKIGRNSRRLDIRSHYLSGASGHGIDCQCLIVSYQKGIMVCQATALTDPAVKLVPSGHWLHAMDTRTYPAQQARQFRPQCRDEFCRNYYQRVKDYYLCH